MFLFLLDNIYCLFNAAKRNLQKAGLWTKSNKLFSQVTRCLLIVPQSVPPWVIMFTLTYKCILNMEFMICLSLSCKTICNKTWVLSFARLVVMSCAAPRKTTRLTSWDLESLPNSKRLHLFYWRFSYAFLGNSAKLSRSSQASAGGIQRHRKAWQSSTSRASCWVHRDTSLTEGSTRLPRIINDNYYMNIICMWKAPSDRTRTFMRYWSYNLHIILETINAFQRGKDRRGCNSSSFTLIHSEYP